MKGKLNVIIHFVSSLQSLESILAAEAGTASSLQLASTSDSASSASISSSMTSINTNTNEAGPPQQQQTSSSSTNNDQQSVIPIIPSSTSIASLNTPSNHQSPVSIVHNTPLPSGWEQRMDQNGRIYYIDHINKTTTWIRPNTRPNASSNNPSSNRMRQSNEANRSELNGHGEEANIGITNRHHIGDDTRSLNDTNHPLGDLVGPVNGDAASGASAPNGPPSAAAVATAANTNGTQEITRNGSASSRGNTQGGARVNEVGVRPKPNEQPLPPGWDFSYSDKGRMFFIDHVNKTTSWIDPRTGKPSPTPNFDFESRIGPLPVRLLCF